MMNIDPIESFLATVQSATEAQGSCAVQQSIAEWLAYYRWLRPISRGRPLATELDQRALFVLFAQATLDGIAATFCCFFRLPWTRAEVSHRRLTAAFPALCLALKLQGETEEVYARLCDLHIRLQVPGPVGKVGHGTLHDIMTAIDAYIHGLGQLFACNRTPGRRMTSRFQRTRTDALLRDHKRPRRSTPRTGSHTSVPSP
jgi:hypothetical protein